jgi:hypothetical protein
LLKRDQLIKHIWTVQRCVQPSQPPGHGNVRRNAVSPADHSKSSVRKHQWAGKPPSTQHPHRGVKTAKPHMERMDLHGPSRAVQPGQSAEGDVLVVVVPKVIQKPAAGDTFRATRCALRAFLRSASQSPDGLRRGCAKLLNHATALEAPRKRSSRTQQAATG